MWELDHKEGWAPKNWCFQTVVLEKTPESLLDSKEIKSVKPKGNPPWIFTGRTYAEAPMHWPPELKSQSLEKTLMLGKIRGRRRRRWQRMRCWVASSFNWHEFEQSLGESEEQGSLVYCSPRGCKKSDMTEWLNSNNNGEVGCHLIFDIIIKIPSTTPNFLWNSATFYYWQLGFCLST